MKKKNKNLIALVDRSGLKRKFIARENGMSYIYLIYLLNGDRTTESRIKQLETYLQKHIKAVA